MKRIRDVSLVSRNSANATSRESLATSDPAVKLLGELGLGALSSRSTSAFWCHSPRPCACGRPRSRVQFLMSQCGHDSF